MAPPQSKAYSFSYFAIPFKDIHSSASLITTLLVITAHTFSRNRFFIGVFCRLAGCAETKGISKNRSLAATGYFGSNLSDMKHKICSVVKGSYNGLTGLLLP